jgi:hypothetical protein
MAVILFITAQPAKSKKLYIDLPRPRDLNDPGATAIAAHITRELKALPPGEWPATVS